MSRIIECETIVLVEGVCNQVEKPEKNAALLWYQSRNQEGFSSKSFKKGKVVFPRADVERGMRLCGRLRGLLVWAQLEPWRFRALGRISLDGLAPVLW